MTTKSCMETDQSGLPDDSPLKVSGRKTPTVDLGEIVQSAAKGLVYPNYYAHSYRQDRFDFTPGRPKKVQYIIMHFMAGSYSGSINWNLNPNANNSWHYGVSYSGRTIQMLSEYDRGWHAANWYINQRSVGIEQEGYGRPGDWTNDMLHASAKIAAGVVLRHNIPINRNHIFGHSEVKGATHTDVGKHFPWRRFMQLVRYYADPDKKKQEPTPSPAKPQAPETVYFAVGDGRPAQRLAEAAVRALRGHGVRAHMLTDTADHNFALRKAISGKLGEYPYVIVGPEGWEATDKSRTKNSGSPSEGWLGRNDTDIWANIYPGNYEDRRDGVARAVRLTVNRSGGDGQEAAGDFYKVLRGKA